MRGHWQPWALGVTIALCAAPYLPSVAFDFTFDDANAILGHLGVTGPPSLTNLGLRDFWGRSFLNTVGSYRPTTTLTYWIDWHIGGGRPWPFHLGNLALYSALLWVVERFLHRFYGDGLPFLGRLATVAVFGSLAIHADVVPSAVGRAEILAALLALLAILAPLRTQGPVRWQEVVLTTGATLLAIGAKESALPVAFLAPVLAQRWHAARGTDRRTGMIALTAANALALAAVVAFRVLRMPWQWLGADRAAENTLVAAGGVGRMLGAVEVLADYAGHLAWPVRLAPDYSYAGIMPGHSPARVVAGAALLGLLLAALARARKPTLGVADAAIAFVASYVASSSVFVPASVIADRLFFFPSLWVVTLVVVASRRLDARAAGAAGALAVGVASAQVFVVARDELRWRDDVTLMAAAVEARPTVARSRRNFAQALVDAGRVQDAAWQLIVSHSILARYPALMQGDEFPASWDRLPIQVRLGELRRAAGDPPLRNAMGAAASTFRRWGNPEAALLIETWETSSD